MTERISYPMPNEISNQAFVLRQWRFIRYQYKEYTNLLNLDHLIRVVKSTDETDTFALHIYTTTDDWYMHGDEAALLWDALNAQPGIVEAQS